uniref:Transmembrane protein n=1 Tax=Pediastrum duplex TaxID=3105 RepID=A0A2U8GJ64_PEDDU|nr:hypothetical protein [Pediastrum duplex]
MVTKERIKVHLQLLCSASLLFTYRLLCFHFGLAFFTSSSLLQCTRFSSSVERRFSASFASHRLPSLRERSEGEVAEGFFCFFWFTSSHRCFSFSLCEPKRDRSERSLRIGASAFRSANRCATEAKAKSQRSRHFARRRHTTKKPKHQRTKEKVSFTAVTLLHIGVLFHFGRAST